MPSRVRGTAFTPPELVTALLGHCVRWWQILHEAHAPAGACSGERANYWESSQVRYLTKVDTKSMEWAWEQRGTQQLQRPEFKIHTGKYREVILKVTHDDTIDNSIHRFIYFPQSENSVFLSILPSPSPLTPSYTHTRDPIFCIDLYPVFFPIEYPFMNVFSTLIHILFKHNFNGFKYSSLWI